MNNSDDIPSLQSAARDQEHAPSFHEVYEIVSTVELVHDNRIYRIEILKSYSGDPDRFSSHVYRREGGSDSYRWQSLEIGWVACDSVDSALAKTIGFLRRVTHGR